MSMRSSLALRQSDLSGVLDKRGSFTETAVLLHRQGRHAAGPIVRDQDVLPGFVDEDMARPTASRRHGVQRHELPALWIDTKRADRSGFLSVKVVQFAHRVHEPAIGMNGEKGRIGSLGRQSDGGQLAIRGVEAVGVDALAGGAGVGSDVNEVIAIGGRLLRGLGGRHPQRRGEQRQHKCSHGSRVHCGAA
jgi:hypothetical protein